MAHGKGHRPREDQGGQRQDHRQAQPVPDEFPDGTFPFEGHAEFALAHDVPDPLEVLDIDGLIQAVAHFKGGDHILFHQIAGRVQLGNHGGQVVPGRQLDDDEGNDGDPDEGGDHQQKATCQIAEHGNGISGARQKG